MDIRRDDYLLFSSSRAQWIMYAELLTMLFFKKNHIEHMYTHSLPHYYLIIFITENLYLSLFSLIPLINVFFSVSYIFGAITMTSGILGVPLGSYLSTRLSKIYPRADPVICAVGLLLSAPLIAAAMILITVNSSLAYIFVFFGQITLNLNWAIVADMLLVRIPCLSNLQTSNSFHFLPCSFVFVFFVF